MKFCVIGLGQFGRNLALELASEKHEVLAIDHNAALVDSIKDRVEMAVRADATRLEDLQALGVGGMDLALVAIGEDFAASLTIVSHLQKLKVKQIIARTINDVHDHILELMGIEERILPEQMAARQFAKRLGIRRATKHFALGESYSIVELEAPAAVVGKTLAESKLREKYRLNLITTRCTDAKGTFTISGVPDPASYRIAETDHLIVFGREDDIRRFSGA
ncbi:MAG TPA: TrkA family potassium uptake protein [Opitutales bacterium]|mgnify:CR=1 FL=1|nr:TrkA family potassium uptake protein [Opitutales bacterium]